MQIKCISVGTAMHAHCELLHMMHKLNHAIIPPESRKLKITVDAPTSSPLFYNLPTLVSDIGKNYEARLTVTSHFILITDCNEENVSTRQCQLHCRRKYLKKKCELCRAASLDDQLLGIANTPDYNYTMTGCTIEQYGQC